MKRQMISALAALLGAVAFGADDILNVAELQLWYPANEVIPTLMSPADGAREAVAAIVDESGQELFSQKLPLTGGKTVPVLKVDDIRPGKWVLKVVDTDGNAAEKPFVWPEATPRKEGRRNNFVTVLLQRKGVDVTPENPLVFDNPREGWLCLTLCAETDAVMSMDGASGKEMALRGGERAEIMRYAPKGRCRLAASTSVRLAECDIRTVAELIFCEYEGMKSRKMYASLMQSPAAQAFPR